MEEEVKKARLDTQWEPSCDHLHSIATIYGSMDDYRQLHQTPEPLFRGVYEARFALDNNEKDDDDHRGDWERAILINVEVLEATQTIGGVTRDVKKEAQLAANKWVKSDLEHKMNSLY